MHTPHTDTDTITPLIARYLDIEQVVQGGGKLPYVMRYHGQLRVESERAHRELSAALKAQKLSVHLLADGKQHALVLTPLPPRPRRSNPWLNLAFFLLTLASMLYTGMLYGLEEPLPTTLASWFSHLGEGLPFAAALLSILLAHEFGHYLAARYHGSEVSLPYFLPLPAPFSPFGTLGAFIQLKEVPRNKKVLFDIGVAGPLAGLLVAIPVLLLGLQLSTLEPLPRFVAAGDAISLEGNSILYLLSKYAVFGQWLPAPQSYAGVPPLLYWARYLFTGAPSPLGGMDVFLHPVAWAGWAGLLVTSLNLIPVGQLDGGHILYALLGKRVRALWPVIVALLAILGFFYSGWWVWTFLILFLGRASAEPLDQVTPLNPARKAVAILAILLFFLVFTPLPLTLITGPFGGP
ncbi:MAG: site-2 protease family protein [Anaerolineales bacterium]|jgi:membrane-associated protease RseP (regulator of RpoE activity)|nr:site-2 protease family protein [Anaerolineales bacterium]MCW5838863.1 site-2 protease family protein [Anaerolineales bacterium]